MCYNLWSSGTWHISTDVVRLGSGTPRERNKSVCTVGDGQRRRALAGPRGRPGAGGSPEWRPPGGGWDPERPGSVGPATASPAFRAAARVAEGTGEATCGTDYSRRGRDKEHLSRLFMGASLSGSCYNYCSVESSLQAADRTHRRPGGGGGGPERGKMNPSALFDE